MPRGDRTGPEGRGRMTGRGDGYCTGNNRPGNQSGYSGRSVGYNIINVLRLLFGGHNRKIDNNKTK